MKLCVENLCYSIDRTQILHNVDIQVEEGSFVGLIGPNGSGKSTLLRNIYRALTPESGAVYLNNTDIRKLTFRESALQMSVLRQESSTDFDYTVRELVMMGRAPHHTMFESEDENDENIVTSALQKVGMLESEKRTLSTLSGGEKQRVLFARALAQSADFLILDEPTNHLDIYYKLQIMELVRSLNITVLSAIHDMDLACRYCDWLIVLKEGRVVGQGTPEDVVTPQMLQDVFHVKANVAKDKDTDILTVTYIGTV